MGVRVAVATTEPAAEALSKSSPAAATTTGGGSNAIVALLSRRQTWQHAIATVAVVLRNALLSAVAALVTTWSCSRGNVVSRRSLAAQSYGEFLLATLLSGHFCFCVVATLTQSTLLLRLRFVASTARSKRRRPERFTNNSSVAASAPATLVGAVRRVARRSVGFYLLSLAVLVGITVACNASALPRRVREYKLEAYVGWLCCFAYTIGVGLAGRFVYKNETVEGRTSTAISTGVVAVRRLDANHKARPTIKKKPKLTTATAAATVAPLPMQMPAPTASVSVRVLARSPTLWQRSTRFWHAWWHVVEARAPILLVGCVTLAYVQALSTRSISRNSEVLALVVSNVALKLLIQRLARRVLLPRDVKTIRTMVIAVGPPIALVDTQLRVILQRANSTQLTVVGTALLALLEVAVRAAKALATRRQLQRDWQGAEQEQPPSTQHSAVHDGEQEREPEREHEREAPLRATAKLLAFRSAELYADMVAEYIAMGCATSILLVYWNHPKYRLAEGVVVAGGPRPSETTATTATQWSDAQTAALVLQVLVEIAVDTLSCSLEISCGVSFDGVREQRVYLAFVFVATAVGNVLISAVVFLRVDAV
ncbi:hypothetical protein PINS_up010267 [Pythium insidiosum]|nr:hypothetical protein PINS_up010267 [Pythium insidiosum]